MRPAHGWRCRHVGHPLRRIGPADTDGDIVTWTIDFGDGTAVGGSWAAEPPAGVAHDYSRDACAIDACMITLTVTVAAGQSGSVSMRMVFLDVTPD